MKAVVWTKYGPPEVLQLREAEKPTPKDNEVLIRIRATTVTKGDCEMRSLQFPLYLNLAMRLWRGLLRPRGTSIMGTELAGEVEAVGKDVGLFEVGDQVFGSAGLDFGANAEYICLPEAPREMEGGVAIKPASMSYEEAATVPFGGRDALHFLLKANIQTGQKLLINGAGGSIGTFAVQLAKYFGAEVTAVDSGPKLDMLRSIGADHVIDYTREDFTKSGQRYDLILDNVANHALADCRRALTPQGIHIPNSGHAGMGYIIKALVGSLFIRQQGPTFVAIANNKDLVALKELIEAGKVTSVIDRAYPLSETPQAFRYLNEGHARGKVVITVKSMEGNKTPQQKRDYPDKESDMGEKQE